MSIFTTHITDILERNRISRELIALYAHRTLVRAAMAVAGVFAVIFIYQHFGNSLTAVLWTFGIMYFGVALLTPLSAGLLSQIGTRTTIALALPCLAFAVMTLYAVAVGESTPLFSTEWGVALFVLCGMLFRAFYWVPYQVDMSQLLDRSRRGVQLAFLENSADASIATMPFLGGLITATFGFSWLFLFSVAIIFLAVVF